MRPVMGMNLSLMHWPRALVPLWYHGGRLGVSVDAPLLTVVDVQQGLEDLGRAARARTSAKIVAITGSAGKTSTKEMLREMLAPQGITHASVASYNNHWGVPLTLARMARDVDFAVVEIGMNHPGEIAPLAQLARPDVAVVTTVAEAHLEAFSNVSEIAGEKAALMSGLQADGIAVLNAEIETAGVLRHEASKYGCKAVWFGTASSDAQLLNLKQTGNATLAEVSISGQKYTLHLKTIGRHFAINALAALLAVQSIGADLRQALKALEMWQPGFGRGAREKIRLADGTVDLIDDAYNANPASMRAALDMISVSSAPRRIAFLGDMKELGVNELDQHRALAQWPALGALDQIHTVGPLMRALHTALPREMRGVHFTSSDEMAKACQDLIKPKDCVLVKASLSMGLQQVVDVLRKLGHSEPNADNR
jgi:UDP-N-acetylmuramoyl-tripeptide--D-alanyl-D-alanine ligase